MDPGEGMRQGAGQIKLFVSVTLPVPARK